MARTYSVKQIIAIRKKAEAKAAGGAVAEVAVEAGAEGSKPAKEKAPRLVVAKVTHPGDERMVPLSITKGELGAALGVEGAGGPADRGAALKTIAAAVAQPTYLREGVNVTRLAERVVGLAGLELLMAEFGAGSIRRTYVDSAILKQLESDPAVVDALTLLQDVSDNRQAARNKRFEAIKAANAKRAAEAAEPEMAEAA